MKATRMCATWSPLDLWGVESQGREKMRRYASKTQQRSNTRLLWHLISLLLRPPSSWPGSVSVTWAVEWMKKSARLHLWFSAARVTTLQLLSALKQNRFDSHVAVRVRAHVHVHCCSVALVSFTQGQWRCSNLSTMKKKTPSWWWWWWGWGQKDEEEEKRRKREDEK